MLETIIAVFWAAALSYAVAGLIFAVPFALFWAGRLDTAAQHGSWAFRLAILPGAIALWPLMALKTLRASRHSSSPPDPERPASPGVQRRIHGLAFVAIALIVPAICAAALFSRPRVDFSIAKQLQPAPLPDFIPLEAPSPDGLPVRAGLRSDGSKYQVELEVSGAIDEPVIAVYWSGENAPAGESIFLGSVWGPSRLLFELPIEGHLAPGVLTFVALTDNQRVLGVLPVRSR